MTRVLNWLMLCGLLAGELAARAGGGGGYSGGGGSSGGGSSGGGGSSYSGGSSSYSGSSSYDSDSGGGGVDDDGLGAWIILGVFTAFVIYGIFANWRDKRAKRHRKINAAHKRREKLREIQKLDPNFSRVLFLSFAHLVYVKYQESVGGIARKNENEFAVLPYLNEKLRAKVREGGAKISEVVVGGISIPFTNIASDQIRIVVEYDANVVFKKNNKRWLYRHRMTFARTKTATTREPSKVLDLGCPKCGSAEEPKLTGECPSCGAINNDGQYDWTVVDLTTMLSVGVDQPVSNGGAEVGTNLPTVVSPTLARDTRDLQMRDPEFDWKAFHKRAEIMFMAIQTAWTERDEAGLRPYETDTIFDSHRYWLERYREGKIINKLSDIEILSIEPSAIEHDAFFDAITVRIRAKMKDWHESESGTVLWGSKSKTKEFTEYWTLIRRNGRTTKSDSDARNCPNCGASLDRVNMAGVCEYCNSNIVTGDFDWVLAIIDQDEEYHG